MENKWSFPNAYIVILILESFVKGGSIRYGHLTYSSNNQVLYSHKNEYMQYFMIRHMFMYSLSLCVFLHSNSHCLTPACQRFLVVFCNFCQKFIWQCTFQYGIYFFFKVSFFSIACIVSFNFWGGFLFQIYSIFLTYVLFNREIDMNKFLRVL